MKYIKKRDIEYEKSSKRNNMILEAYKNGGDAALIALDLGISQRRVHQIISRYKKKV